MFCLTDGTKRRKSKNSNKQTVSVRFCCGVLHAVAAAAAAVGMD